MSETLTVSRDGSVATVWLDRSEKRNAMTLEMWTGVAQTCASLATDPAARVLVLRGTGGHFCAGADVGALGGHDGVTYAEANRAAEDALVSFPKPTIAFITGSCVGGGVQLAAACDLRIADTTARLGITPARLGIVFPAPSLRRVVGLIGASAAKHLLYSAELIGAERALRIGLLDEVHEPSAALERLTAFTSMLSERSLLTQAASKEMVNAIVEQGGVADAMTERWNREVAASPDLAEGIAAFLEHRAPVFSWSLPHERR